MHFRKILTLVFLGMSCCTSVFANGWAREIIEQNQSYYSIQQTYPPATWPKVMIFVSTSMPKTALQQWAKQAEKLEVPLCLRGLVDNSLKATIKKTKEIFGDEMLYGFEIHPEAFQSFNIQSIPAVVLITEDVKQDFDAPERLPKFDMVSGNIGLEAALILFAKQGTPKGRSQATQLLEQYRRA